MANVKLEPICYKEDVLSGSHEMIARNVEIREANKVIKARNEMIEECDLQRPTEIRGLRVYEGKFKDRFVPELYPAGELTYDGETVARCLITEPTPPWSEVVRRYRATSTPRYGDSRVYHGKAYDRELEISKLMTHGICTKSHFDVGKLVNPPPKSRFQQHLINRQESIYESHVKKPVGSGKDQRKHLPSLIDPKTFTFGVWSERDGSAGQLINPNKNYEQVHCEACVGHDKYRLTHNSYGPSERLTRYYANPSFDRRSTFGKPTPHDNTGLLTKKSMRWLQYTEAEKLAPIISKREDDYNERSQHQLGRTLDPIRDTLNVPINFAFGANRHAEPYGVGELIHYRTPDNYLRGKDAERSIIALVRHHLKKANYRNFDTLLQAFEFYDKAKVGKIDIESLRETCLQFNIPLSREYLQLLMDYCDADKDGLINYVEFANFLNWKDIMPSGLPNTPQATSSEMPLVNGQPERLIKQIDKPSTELKTSASMINAVFGGINTENWRNYGVPCIRSDLPAPLIRKCDNHINYGDESDVWGLIQPSIFSSHGVYERDLLAPRTKQEIFDIFTKIGVKMECSMFDCLYDMAAKQSPKGQVSVDSFRHLLDQCQEIVTNRTLGPVMN